MTMMAQQIIKLEKKKGRDKRPTTYHATTHHINFISGEFYLARGLGGEVRKGQLYMIYFNNQFKVKT